MKEVMTLITQAPATIVVTKTEEMTVTKVAFIKCIFEESAFMIVWVITVRVC